MIPLGSATDFRAELEGVRDVLAEAAGFIGGEVGQNLDEPTLWVLTTRWENVGSYRRALEFNARKARSDPSACSRNR